MEQRPEHFVAFAPFNVLTETPRLRNELQVEAQRLCQCFRGLGIRDEFQHDRTPSELPDHLVERSRHQQSRLAIHLRESKGRTDCLSVERTAWFSMTREPDLLDGSEAGAELVG